MPFDYAAPRWSDENDGYCFPYVDGLGCAISDTELVERAEQDYSLMHDESAMRRLAYVCGYPGDAWAVLSSLGDTNLRRAFWVEMGRDARIVMRENEIIHDIVYSAAVAHAHLGAHLLVGVFVSAMNHRIAEHMHTPHVFVRAVREGGNMNVHWSRSRDRLYLTEADISGLDRSDRLHHLPEAGSNPVPVQNVILLPGEET